MRLTQRTCSRPLGITILAGVVALGAPAVPLRAAGTTLSFAPAVDYPANVNDVATADLDSDGVLDLITSDSNNSQVGVLLGDGQGAFGALTSFPAANTNIGLVTGLLNGDDIPDVVTANPGPDSISVLLGNGDGTLAAAVDYTTGGGGKGGTSPDSLALGDVNGDSHTDIVAGNSGEASIDVLLGNGDGTFQANVTYATGSDTKPDSVALGHMDGDNTLDVVFAAGSVGVKPGYGRNHAGRRRRDVRGAFGVPGRSQSRRGRARPCGR